jgi:hypothetical protein
MDCGFDLRREDFKQLDKDCAKTAACLPGMELVYIIKAIMNGSTLVLGAVSGFAHYCGLLLD